MATKSNSQELSSLVINKVASPTVYASMVSGGQINADELYLVAGDETVTYSLGQDGDTITLTGSDGSTSSVSADASGTASTAVSAHNSSATAHSDIRSAIPTATSQLTNDSGFITTGDIPEGAAASTTVPAMDGTASTGTELAFARGDHVHPSDTSRVPTTRTVNGKALSADISLDYSDVGAAASSHGTHVTYSTTTPVMDGTATVGTASTVSRSDHVHPTDTSRAPTSHASSATTYGKGTSSNYGHVKLSDATNGTSAAASGGVAATPKAVSDALTSAKSYADGISANDFTDTLKSKLEGIESGAQVNTVTSVNSKTGAVSLTYSDVGAAASSHGTHVTFTTTKPVMDGTAAVGTATTVSRSDHVHPTDTSRASASDLSTHTSDTTVHITATERSTWNAKADSSDIPTKTSELTNDSGFITTSDIPEGAAASTTTPKMDGTASTGTELAFARGDHVHPTDTSRAPTSHAASATTYGKGTTSNYGHVKLSDSTSGTATAASGGTAATPKAVADALNSAKSYADGISANDFTDTLKSKLDGIESGAQVNTVTSVNSKTGAVSLTYSDVGAAASSHGTHVTYSTTKPVMDGTAAAGTASTVARSDHVHPTDTSRAAASHTHSASDITSGLADVATSGSYNDLDDLPAIPNSTSDLTNDSGFITSSDIPVTSVNSKTGAVSLTYTDVGAAASSHGTHVTFDTTNNPKMDGTASKGTATTVARSDHVHPTDTSRAAASHTHVASDITSGLASVATSGSYNDLSNTPAIPDSTSDLTNDSGYITSADIPVTSVNSKTGAVSLTYSDVGAAASSHGTHVTYSTTSPKMNGTAAVGTATTVSRSDHVHPVDTSRAPSNHAWDASDTDTTYGKATEARYGHAVVINNLTTSSHTMGYALSAYQGYRLDQNKADKDVFAYKQVSGTTTSGGKLSLGIADTAGHVYAVKASGQNYICIPYCNASGTWYAHVANNSMSTLASTAVTLDVYYIVETSVSN